MPTHQQLIRQKRVKVKKKSKAQALTKCPQKRGICIKVYTLSPNKPNSAIRKVAYVKLTNKRRLIVYIPGEGHNLREHSSVLVQGGKTQDLTSVRCKVIRGTLDAAGVEKCAQGRSKRGTKKPK